MKEAQKHRATKTPTTVKVTQIIILAIGVLWIGFSIFIALGFHPTYSRMGGFQWIVAVMTLVPGIILVILWFLLRKHWKPAWFLTVIALAVMTVAGLFDQVGWVDVLVMFGSAIPFVLLLIDRMWYLKTRS